jgi:ribosomal-protein-alanine N-acetyltransferase
MNILNEIILRPLVEEDLAAVLAIEETAFASPWTRASFLQELQSSHSHLTVAERQGQVIGYVCCWHVADEVQILDIAVHPVCRRQGVGECLLRHALASGQHHGALSANLEVRCSNLAAIALYKKLGFCEAGVRPRYYADGEDALVMICRFPEHPSLQEENTEKRNQS